MRPFRAGEQQSAVAVVRREAQSVVRLLVFGLGRVVRERRVRQEVLRRGVRARDVARQSAVLRVDLGPVVEQVVVVLVGAREARARLGDLPAGLVGQRAARQALLLTVPEDHEEDGGGEEEAHRHEHADDDGQVGLLRVPVVGRRFCTRKQRG